MGRYSVEAIPQTEALPDIPGLVHGIKSEGPIWEVQCDDCLTLFRGEWLLPVAKSATFNARSDVKHLRLCDSCWALRGWHDTTLHGWTYREPATAIRGER